MPKKKIDLFIAKRLNFFFQINKSFLNGFISPALFVGSNLVIKILPLPVDRLI